MDYCLNIKKIGLNLGAKIIAEIWLVDHSDRPAIVWGLNYFFNENFNNPNISYAHKMILAEAYTFFKNMLEICPFDSDS